MEHGRVHLNDIDISVSPFYAAIRRTWLAFCASSSMHGLKYTLDRDTNKFVRFIWMLITVIMFACAILMVRTFYLSYRSNPTRINIEKDHAPVESLDFPAVTICPEALYNMGAAKRYLETLNHPPGTNLTQLMQALTITYGFINDDDIHDNRDIELLQQLIDLNDISMLTFMGKLQWDCDEILFRCRFHWRITECDELFHRSRTYYGYCCSFNINQDNLSYPVLNARAGLFDGLSLILELNDTFDDARPNYSDGFKVLLSENDAFPSGHSVIKFTPPKQENFLGIRPIETYCSQSVTALSVEERRCVLPHEFALKNFPKYVASNCDLDFRVESMLTWCGCMTYFFHTNRTNTRICAFKDIPCLIHNAARFLGRYMNAQSDCPNNCESTTFNVELTNSEIQVDIPTVDNFYSGIHGNHSVVHIFINSEVYRRIRRDLLSSEVTLISNLGSTFSLFVGLSMICVVEVFYYLTVVLRKHYVQEVAARKKLQPLSLKNNW